MYDFVCGESETEKLKCRVYAKGVDYFGVSIACRD